MTEKEEIQILMQAIADDILNQAPVLENEEDK